MRNDAVIIAQLDQARGITGEVEAEGTPEQECGEVSEWPIPFFETNKGVWFRPSHHAKGGKPEPSAIWVCAPFAAVAETADEASSSWGLLLRWKDRDGRAHEWAMPRRLLHLDGNHIAAELDHAGLSVRQGIA